MGNFFDKIINGPPFAPRCDPECTPGPDNRGIQCYKGKCVPDCPLGSEIVNGKCSCQGGFMFVDQNLNKDNPILGKGWGYCISDGREEERIQKRLDKIMEENPDMTEEEIILERQKLQKKIEIEDKKEQIKYKPESIFIEKPPAELDSRVKEKLKKKLEENPDMTEEEIIKLTSRITHEIIQELALECKEEYKIMETILSKKYGDGKWPNKYKLIELITTKNFPWKISHVENWPEEQDILSCSLITSLKNQIEKYNEEKCKYSKEYTEIVNKCNVKCGKGVEERRMKILKSCNIDFPPFVCEDKQKKFICEDLCPEDCKYDVNNDPDNENSILNAQCSQSCDYGKGPGEKTYEVTYRQHPKNGGTCNVKDWEYKSAGDKAFVTESCNEDKCDPCKIDTKIPYKGEYADYTKFEKQSDGTNKVYSKCLINGKGTHNDCGGIKGDFNYIKGARTKYDVTYNITKDAKGIQNCFKGDNVIKEDCPKIAKDNNGEDIFDINGNPVPGGGDTCPDTCEIIGEKKVGNCSKVCTDEEGPGKQKMMSVIKPGTSSAANCLCKSEPEKCTWEVDCNKKLCDKPCIYFDEKNLRRVQVNDFCPGVVGGANENIRYDTEKEEWHNIVTKETYPFYKKDNDGNFLKDENDNKIATFVKDMRVPTLKPPFGEGTCHDKPSTEHLTIPCSITDDNKKPIPGKWGKWVYQATTGDNTTVKKITEVHSNWSYREDLVIKHEVKEKPTWEVFRQFLIERGVSLRNTSTDKDTLKIMEKTHSYILDAIPNKTKRWTWRKKGYLYGPQKSDNQVYYLLFKVAYENENFPFKNIYTKLDVGKEVIGSGTMDWPEDNDINKVVEKVKGLGHVLSRTVDIINKKDGKIKLYERGNIGYVYGDSWILGKGKQINTNHGKEGKPCINDIALGMTGAATPGKIFYRDYQKSQYDPTGKYALKGEPIKKEPFMRKIKLERLVKGTKVGKKIIIGSGEFDWPIGEDLQPVIDKFREIRHKVDESWDKIKFIEKSQGKMNFYKGIDPEDGIENTFDSTAAWEIKYEEGYESYCPLDSGGSLGILGAPWEQYEWKDDDKGIPRCKSSYTEKELIAESKRKFIRDKDLPLKKYGVNKEQITGVGTRTIYRVKSRPLIDYICDENGENCVTEKYGGMPMTGWHDSVGSTRRGRYDHRPKLYDECPGVGETLDAIRNNVPNWQKTMNVKGKECKPIYDWDGKFYFDRRSVRKKESDPEEIISPVPGAAIELYEKGQRPDKFFPHRYAVTFGDQYLASSYTKGFEEPHLESLTGWTPRSSKHGEYIQIKTKSGKIENIKGVVIKGNYSNEYHTKTFLVMVSRNGHSWKTIKNPETNSEVWNGSESSAKRHFEEKRYFKELEEAVYIRIFPIKGGGGGIGLRVGYIKGDQRLINCWNGSGRGQDEYWMRFKFNEQATRDNGGWHEGNGNGQICPDNNSTMLVSKGFGQLNIESGVLKEENLQLNDNGEIKNLKTALTTGKFLLEDCGVDPDTHGWQNDNEGGSTSWTECRKPSYSGLESILEPPKGDAVCENDSGYQYMYNNWKTQGQNDTNGYKKPDSTLFRTVKNWDEPNWDVNVIRKPCHRDKCHKLPVLDRNVIISTDCSTAGTKNKGYLGTIVNIRTPGVDGFVKGQPYTMENFYNHELFPQLNKFLGTPNASGNPAAWTVRDYWVSTKWDSREYCGYTGNRIMFDMNLMLRNIYKTSWAIRGKSSVHKMTDGMYKIQNSGKVEEGSNSGCKDIWTNHYKARGWGYRYVPYTWENNDRMWGKMPRGCQIREREITYNENGHATTDLCRRNNCIIERVKPLSWIIVGFTFQASGGDDFKDKSPGILKVDPLNMDHSPSKRNDSEEPWRNIKIPAPTKKRQTYTFIFRPDIREALSEDPKIRFEGTRSDGKKNLQYRIALHYGILNKGFKSMEKGQTGCTAGEDPVDCRMNPWSELGYEVGGVHHAGRCSTDDSTKEGPEGYGKKCAYYKDGTGKHNTNGLVADKSGIMYKIRTVKRRGAGGGDDSCKYETTKESAPIACNREDCPVDCQYNPKTEWVKTPNTYYGKQEYTIKGSCAGDDCNPWTLVCNRRKKEENGWERDASVKVQAKHGGTACVSQKEQVQREWYITENWNC